MMKATPPSPSLNGSLLSFGMQPQGLRLSPVEQNKIFSQLKQCNAIRYAAYRTASKLEVLQSSLRLEHVKFGVVCNVFHHHGLGPSENDVVLDGNEASDVISDIFFATSKVRNYYSAPMDLEALTEATLKFASLIYDPNGCGGVLVKALKVFFILLSEGRLRDKFMYLFRQFSDHNNFISRKNLRSLLNTISEFPQFFGEAVSFGPNLVEGSVLQCFQGRISEGVTEDQFTSWLMREPQIIVWLPTNYRLTSAKGVRHGRRCNSCKMEDIIGMRYQCLRCIRYDLCQHCFFYGHTTRHHKLEHPMQEYCYRSSKKDATKALMKLLMNNLRRRKLSHMRQRYTSPLKNPHGEAKDKMSEKNSDDSSGFHSSSSSDIDVPDHGNRNKAKASRTKACEGGESVTVDPDLDHTVVRQEGDQIVSQHQKMFNSIVLHMEEHNNAILEKCKGSQQSPRTLSKAPLDNCVSMQVQLNRLKSLMDSIFGSVPTHSTYGKPSLILPSLGDPSLIESTPVMKTGRRSDLFNVERNFSPIILGTHLPGIENYASGVARSLNVNPSEYNESSHVLSSGMPSLSEVSMGDLSSYLVKTGKVPMEPNELERLNITDALQDQDEHTLRSDTTMEEMEGLMLKLDHVFHSFTVDPHLQNRNCKDHGIKNIVSEIGDMVHSFTYAFRQDHELLMS